MHGIKYIAVIAIKALLLHCENYLFVKAAELSWFLEKEIWSLTEVVFRFGNYIRIVL